jgi:hypothetical protein
MVPTPYRGMMGTRSKSDTMMGYCTVLSSQAAGSHGTVCTILRHVQLILCNLIPASAGCVGGLMFRGGAGWRWGGVVAIKSLSRIVVFTFVL